MQCKCYKVYLGYINPNRHNEKKRKKTPKKSRFLKELVENADFYKRPYNDHTK